MSRRWPVKKIIWGVVVLLIIAGAYFFSTAAFCWRESFYIRPGSYASFACVSGLIRSVPQVGQVTEVQFFSSIGDGPKPGESAVWYATNASREEVERTLLEYFAKKGIHLDKGESRFAGSEPPTYSGSSHDQLFEISVDPSNSDSTGSRLKVEVRQLY